MCLLVLGTLLLCPDSVSGIPQTPGGTERHEEKENSSYSRKRTRSKNYVQHNCNVISAHVQRKPKPKELIPWEMHFACEALVRPLPW